MVLFAGIAAEALIYGEAEGGENDENLFRSICIQLEPPFSIAQVLFYLLLFMFNKIFFIQYSLINFLSIADGKSGTLVCFAVI